MDQDEVYHKTNAKLMTTLYSPDWKYRLDVYKHPSPKIGIHHGEVVLHRVSTGERITSFRNDQPNFSPSWVMFHSNGHSYLIGAGQSEDKVTIELDTGRVLSLEQANLLSL